ncbi:MAG: PepSY domain-containing protein, partial [Caldilinea sp.]|nr:PepSY domain-containing protein [Caldilinea sp.]
PQQPVASTQVGEDGKINARAAIAIAEQAVESELTGAITEKVATPEDRDGKSVWVVELSTDTQNATVVVDAETGDVIETTIN